MLRLSKKVEYALIAMMHMARKSRGELTSVRELSAVFNIPQEVTGKVLQTLARKGVIESVQGVKGGYRLGFIPGEITLSRVIASVDGPVRLVGCADDQNNECSCEQFSRCNIRGPMEIIQDKLLDFFESVSLQYLIDNRFPVSIEQGDKIVANVNFNE